MRLEILKARLERYCEAEAAILSGQSYEIEGLKLTRTNLKNVQDMIAKLDNEISKQQNISSGKARSRIRFVIPKESIET